MSLADAHRLLESVRGSVQCNDRSSGFRKELLERLILEEKKLLKKISISVDGARTITYLDGKGGAYSGASKSPSGSSQGRDSTVNGVTSKGSGLMSLAIFGGFIIILYGALLVATGGK